MRHVLAVLAVVALVAPVYSAVDYFVVTGDGSFDTYHNSDMSACEGYTNAGSGGSARLGYSKQGHAWLAWDAKNYQGTESVSAGQTSGLSMGNFLAANPGAEAYLWIKLSTPTLVGSYAIETLRSGNQGAIQEDNGSGTGFTFASPAAGITGSAQPWAWSAGAPTYPVNGIINGPNGAGVPWIAAGTTSSHYAGGSRVAGQEIYWGGASHLGFDGTMAANGGEAWALAALIGMDWSQGGTSVARAEAAGQIVNVDSNGAPVLLNAAKYVGNTAPRPGAVTGNWYKVPLSAALVTSIATDPMTKALLFNNWFAGTTSSSGNPTFQTKDQAGGVGAAFIEITPEPATLVLLALGGLALIRRRS